MSDPADRLIWMDLEMSGLDAERERVLEIAVVVTDAELEIVAQGPHLVLHQSAEVLAAMDAWNTEHHTASGLVDKVRASTIDEARADELVLAFLAEHTAAGVCPLAGNSVHQDRRFLRRYLPRVDAWMHYRLVDVSTVKELARRWYPAALDAAPPKVEAHRADADVLESIAELRYWRRAVFR